jgi:hypothetical protein
MVLAYKLTVGFAAAALALGMAGVAGAGELKADLVACPTGINIGDVNSCGKIWKLKHGHAHLSSDGKLMVEVKGLVLNDASTGEFNGTPDGVDGVAAAVLCVGASGPAVAAQTDVVPLSKSGDAKVHAKVSVPSGCIAPIVVLRERYQGKIGGWLAGTGL